MSRPLRVLYVAGPGDVVGTHRHWETGADDPSEIAVTYSSQFYEVCRELGVEGWAISHCLRPDRHLSNGMTSENRPERGKRARALLYHLAQIVYGLGLCRSALVWRADVVVTSGATHWAIYRPLAWWGVKVVPTLHCVLWPKHGRPGRGAAWFLRRGSRLFAREAMGIMSLSPDITEQVTTLTGGRTAPVVPFVPNYRDRVLRVGPPPESMAPFELLYAGRIERDKGVFDLLEASRQLIHDRGLDLRVNLCGAGSALDALRAAAEGMQLSDRFVCHGPLKRDALEARFAASHAVVVPTRTEFVEGFNKVVVEAVLAERPVITSSVCPALDLVREAATEVAPNDVAGYADAIARLATDLDYYAQKRGACGRLGATFRDPAHSWGAALRRVILAAKNNQPRDLTPACDSAVPKRSN